ncbi:MYND-type domain-containing protein [Mycena indigotica]|uniref:MYND-type domain-containing protein n=1 Tax=Mycena indigotica TaxID=2126181 RepID=A0A8H6SJ39_9AGAR|nr:MYND-type domain-containing protein [Mycena indigotica]KAF7298780.1 MYND-type domain-containing protein [Mycena indigotica]
MSEMSMSADFKVHLPLAKLESCAKCKSTKTLRLCSACNERTYCSPTCQKQDWADHKTFCGKTDRLDLNIFYPLIGCLVEMGHLRKPQTHPALRQSILNAPNPGSLPTRLPDGSAANLVHLGNRLAGPHQAGSAIWFSQALDQNVRLKFMDRVKREGHVLPILMATSLALLSEIYTTPTSNEKKSLRARLAYRSSPIADFGIASGAAKVTAPDRLAYRDKSTNPSFAGIRYGQDPNDHYWLYFTTIRGETVTLDCGMYTFNMCQMVSTKPYSTHSMLPPELPWVPAFFRERDMDRTTPDMYVERRRMSVLRNPALQTVVHIAGTATTYDEAQASIICSFMETLARRKISREEREFVLSLTTQARNELKTVLNGRSWASWPKVPATTVEMDPDELMEDMMDDDAAWAEYLKGYKKNKKAGMDETQLDQAYRVWSAEQKGRQPLWASVM